MIRYLAKRALSSLVAFFLFITLMFFVVQIIIPTDFTTQFAMTMNQDAREELEQELGIDQPLWEQYLNWLHMLLTGSLGTSFYGPSVVEVLKGVIPYTLLVFFTGTVLAFQFGRWLGKVTAWRGPGLLSGSATSSAIGLYTTFPPWLSFLMIYFFARRLGLLADLISFNPSYNLGQNLRREIWGASTLSVPTVMLYVVVTLAGTAFLLFAVNKALERTFRRRLPLLIYLPLLVAGWVGSWSLLGFRPQALDVLYHASLPVATYVLLSFGETVLIMRTSMMDTLKEEYINLARAKGLPERVVRDKHAARNALLPVFSRLVISLPYLLTGLVIIEREFDWPGMSASLFNAMYNQDIPVVMGALLAVGVLSAVARLILDVLYAYLDPRIRYDAAPSRRFG